MRIQLNPYIYFSGNAAEAIEFYVRVFGAKPESIIKYTESGMPCDEDYKQKIFYARLLFQNNALLISDVFKGGDIKIGENIQLSLEVNDPDELEAIFNRMAEGGTIAMPLQPQSWDAIAGLIKDKFGISWMFNCPMKYVAEKIEGDELLA